MSYFAGIANSQDLVDGLGLLDSPASRELTLQHHSQVDFLQPTPYRADPLRTNFLNSLNALGGYPNQLRRVAVTDGAIDSTPQHDQNGQVIQAGDQAFLLEQRGVPRGSGIGTVARILFPIGLLGRPVTTAKGRVYYGPDFGQSARVLNAYYFPDGATNWSAVGPAGSCSLDAASGGYRKFLGFATDGPTGYFNNMFAKRNFYSVRDRSCFIPTLSALGYTQQPANNCQPAGQNLVCAGTTPFDAYYGPTGHNDEHLHLTPANVEFMRNEILRKTPPPVFATAPNGVCPNGGTAQFSVAAECARAGQPGTTYTWTAGTGLAIVGGQGTATVTVQSAVGYMGTTTLQVVAVRSGYAASTPVVISTVVANSSLTIGSPDSPKCFTEDFEYTYSGMLTQGPVEWHVSLNGVPRDELIVSAASNGQGILVWPDAGGNLDVTATVNGSCTGQPVTASTTTTVVEYVRTYGFEPCPARQNRTTPKATPAAYPNPADDVLTLATPETPAAAAPRTAVLYNGQGREVRRTRAGEARLATADLPTGLYYLMTEQNGQVTRTQIRVQH